MNKPSQLRLGLEPRPSAVVLPVDVMEQAIELVAELLLQVQAAEDAPVVPSGDPREVADEHRA